MSHRVDNERIKQFRKDRRRLPYDDGVIAERMAKSKSNYSKSVNEGPITNAFLEKFYAAFGDELKQQEETRMVEGLGERIKETYEEVLQVKNNVEGLSKKLERMEALLIKYIEGDARPGG